MPREEQLEPMVESNSPDPGRAGFRGVMQSLAATLQSVTEDALGEVPNTTVSFTAEFPDDAPAQITGTVVMPRSFAAS